jgi:hypothetical protein
MRLLGGGMLTERDRSAADRGDQKGEG